MSMISAQIIMGPAGKFQSVSMGKKEQTELPFMHVLAGWVSDSEERSNVPFEKNAEKESSSKQQETAGSLASMAYLPQVSPFKMEADVSTDPSADSVSNVQRANSKKEVIYAESSVTEKTIEATTELFSNPTAATHDFSDHKLSDISQTVGKTISNSILSQSEEDPPAPLSNNTISETKVSGSSISEPVQTADISVSNIYSAPAAKSSETIQTASPNAIQGDEIPEIKTKSDPNVRTPIQVNPVSPEISDFSKANVDPAAKVSQVSERVSPKQDLMQFTEDSQVKPSPVSEGVVITPQNTLSQEGVRKLPSSPETYIATPDSTKISPSAAGQDTFTEIHAGVGKSISKIDAKTIADNTVSASQFIPTDESEKVSDVKTISSDRITGERINFQFPIGENRQNEIPSETPERSTVNHLLSKKEANISVPDELSHQPVIQPERMTAAPADEKFILESSSESNKIQTAQTNTLFIQEPLNTTPDMSAEVIKTSSSFILETPEMPAVPITGNKIQPSFNANTKTGVISIASQPPEMVSPNNVDIKTSNPLHQRVADTFITEKSIPGEGTVQLRPNMNSEDITLANNLQPKGNSKIEIPAKGIEITDGQTKASTENISTQFESDSASVQHQSAQMVNTVSNSKSVNSAQAPEIKVDVMQASSNPERSKMLFTSIQENRTQTSPEVEIKSGTNEIVNQSAVKASQNSEEILSSASQRQPVSETSNTVKNTFGKETVQLKPDLTDISSSKDISQEISVKETIADNGKPQKNYTEIASESPNNAVSENMDSSSEEMKVDPLTSRTNDLTVNSIPADTLLHEDLSIQTPVTSATPIQKDSLKTNIGIASSEPKENITRPNETAGNNLTESKHDAHGVRLEVAQIVAETESSQNEIPVIKVDFLPDSSNSKNSELIIKDSIHEPKSVTPAKDNVNPVQVEIPQNNTISHTISVKEEIESTNIKDTGQTVDFQNQVTPNLAVNTIIDSSTKNAVSDDPRQEPTAVTRLSRNVEFTQSNNIVEPSSKQVDAASQLEGNSDKQISFKEVSIKAETGDIPVQVSSKEKLNSNQNENSQIQTLVENSVPVKTVHSVESTLRTAQTEVQPQAVVSQIARATQKVVREGRHELTVRLDPPELGHLQIRVSSEGGTVTAGFHAESEEVRTLLETHLPILRSVLSDAGVQVQQFTVMTDSQFGQSHQQSGPYQNEPYPQQYGSSISKTMSHEEIPTIIPERSNTNGVDYLA